MTLEELITQAKGSVTFEVEGLLPNVAENLRKLQRLGLLTGEAILCLVGQAPIDPYGIFGALQSYGPWAFQPLDFTAVSILAKKGAHPVALMRIDLLSDDITFVVLKDKKLVEHSALMGAEMMEKMAEPGMKPKTFTTWLRGKMQAAVDAGLADQ